MCYVSYTLSRPPRKVFMMENCWSGALVLSERYILRTSGHHSQGFNLSHYCLLPYPRGQLFQPQLAVVLVSCRCVPLTRCKNVCSSGPQITWNLLSSIKGPIFRTHLVFTSYRCSNWPTYNHFSHLPSTSFLYHVTTALGQIQRCHSKKNGNSFGN